MDQGLSLRIAVAKLQEHQEWRTFSHGRGSLISMETWYLEAYWEGDGLRICLRPRSGGTLACQRVRVTVLGMNTGAYLNEFGRCEFRELPSGDVILEFAYRHGRELPVTELVSQTLKMV